MRPALMGERPPSGPIATRWMAICILVLVLIPEVSAQDRRSTIVLQRSCISDLWHGDLSLFANGTVRLRSESNGERSLQLIELDPVEMEGYLNRIDEMNFAEVEQRHFGPTGDWVARCSLLVLQGSSSEPLRFDYLDLSALPLALTRLVSLAGELEEVLRQRTTLGEIGFGYMPRVGDLLRRSSGDLYEVVGFTSDGSGVELQGVDSPLVEYLSRSEIASWYVELVSRRQPWEE